MGEGASKLKAAQSGYAAAAGAGSTPAGIVEPDKGFELKPGINSGALSGGIAQKFAGPVAGELEPETGGDGD